MLLQIKFQIILLLRHTTALGLKSFCHSLAFVFLRGSPLSDTFHHFNNYAPCKQYTTNENEELQLCQIIHYFHENVFFSVLRGRKPMYMNLFIHNRERPGVIGVIFEQSLIPQLLKALRYFLESKASPQHSIPSETCRFPQQLLDFQNCELPITTCGLLQPGKIFSWGK